MGIMFLAGVNMNIMGWFGSNIFLGHNLKNWWAFKKENLIWEITDSLISHIHVAYCGLHIRGF